MNNFQISDASNNKREQLRGTMSLKLFDLVPVIDRVDLDQGTRIETIEYSVGSLYIGTNNGKLFQVK